MSNSIQLRVGESQATTASSQSVNSTSFSWRGCSERSNGSLTVIWRSSAMVYTSLNMPYSRSRKRSSSSWVKPAGKGPKILSKRLRFAGVICCVLILLRFSSSYFLTTYVEGSPKQDLNLCLRMMPLGSIRLSARTVTVFASG